MALCFSRSAYIASMVVAFSAMGMMNIRTRAARNLDTHIYGGVDCLCLLLQWVLTVRYHLCIPKLASGYKLLNAQLRISYIRIAMLNQMTSQTPN